MSKNIIITIIILIIFTGSSFSQSEYLKNGVSGVGFTISSLNSQSSIGTGATISMSGGGFVDIGYSYSSIEKVSSHGYSLCAYFYKRDYKPLLLALQGSMTSNNTTKSLSIITGFKSTSSSSHGVVGYLGLGTINIDGSKLLISTGFSFFARGKTVNFFAGFNSVTTDGITSYGIGIGLVFSSQDNRFSSDEIERNKDKKVREEEKKKKKKKKRHYYDN